MFLKKNAIEVWKSDILKMKLEVCGFRHRKIKTDLLSQEDDESRLSIASETRAVSVDVDNGYLGQSDGETEENDNNAVSRPTSSAVRMPGGLRKPRLSRTPGEASRKGLDEKGSSSDEDDELNVLITEMPSSAREAADAAEVSSNH